MLKTWNKHFDFIAEKFSEHVALKDGEKSYTYNELAEKVQSLAAVFIENGATRGIKICVMLPNSAEAVISILAVIRSGASYVPVNVNDAIERKLQIISDSEALFIITDEAHETSELKCKQLVYSDRFFEKKAKVFDQNEAEDLIYVLYTSGSTGKPKGAMITHNNLICQMEGLRSEYNLSENDTVSQFHTICFDFSVFEIFCPLYNGGTLAIVPLKAKTDYKELLGFIEEKRVSVLGLVPSVMYKVPVETAKNLPVRLMMVGGENLFFSSLKKWFEKKPDLIVYNGYGLTETTIINTHKKLTVNSNLEDSANIGKAFAPNIMELVDPASGQVIKTPGKEGEIYLGGCTVSLGYWNNEKLTKERYVTLKEYGETPFFKTGDFGRLDENGEVYFTGRKDNQVKIRGFRIEIEEIEAKLRRLENVKNVAVKIDSEKELILAFIVSDVSDAQEIYEEAKKVLPGYMLPHRIKIMDEFPVTDRGKLDKKKLIMKDREGLVSSFIPCESLNEKKIEAIWQELLETQNPIGLKDSFYELGGDSLNIITVIEKINETFGKNIGLTGFIENPTIEYLSKCVSEDCAVAFSKKEIKITHKYSDKYPLTDLQQAYYVGRSSSVALSNCASHSYAELLCPDYDKKRVEEVVNKLIKRHSVLRCYLDDEGNQHILPSLTVSLKELDWTNLSEAERENKKLELRHQMEGEILDTSIAPLARLIITKYSEKEAMIHLYIDALIADGWSHELLLYEADKLYCNLDSELSDTTFSYGDYVEYYENLKKSEQHERDKQFWINRLKEEPENPKLPTGQINDSSKRIVSQQMRKSLSIEEWNQVEKKGSLLGMSGFVIALTAFCKTIARYSKNQKFVINLPVSSRPNECKGIDTLFGVCSNFFLLEFENKNDESLLSTAKRLQKILWELKEHDSFNGNEIVRELYKLNGNVGGFVATIVFTSLLDIPFPRREKIKRAYLETHTSQIWLDTVLMADDEGVSFNCDFVEEIISKSLAENLIGKCVELVRNFAEEPATWNKIFNIELPEETFKALHEKNSSLMPLEDKSIISVFKEQAQKNGNADFIITTNQKVTYKDFYNKTCALCSYIKNKIPELSKGDGIVILTHKDIYQLTAIFAAIASGGVYIPVDDGFPREVVEDIVLKTKAKLIITDNDNFSKAEKIKSEENFVPVINLQNPETLYELEHFNGNFDFAKRSIYDPFVIIFTSGTTGKPKGIKLFEAGILNSVIFTNRRYEISDKDSAIALTNICHDMSMFDMFSMIYAGGKLLLPVQNQARDPESWKKLISKNQLTIINSVPAFTEMLLLSFENDEISNYLSSLRLVIQGGDFLKNSHAKNLKNINSKIKIVNVGGPTETSLWSIYHDVSDEEIASKTIPYGRAISNMKHYIFNDNLELTPPFVEGTIYSEGIGLAECYVAEPELTKKKFIIKNGKRLFNTGDVAYYDSNFEMIIKGRDDNQIKINGKRIELEEIEAAINQLSGISSSCVVFAKNKLCAFYSSKNPFDEELIKKSLSEKLAGYMIPSYIWYSKNIVITRNGKSNRKALTEKALSLLENESSSIENSALPASDEKTEKLLELSRAILENNDFTATDNFFMEGGNSILAIKLISAIKEAFGVKFNIGDIFASPSVNEWRAMLEEKSALTEIMQIEINENHIPLSKAQSGIWFYEQIHKNSKYTVSAHSLLKAENDSFIDEEKLKFAVDYAVNSNAIFDLEFKKDSEGLPYQCVKKSGGKKNVLEIINAEKSFDEYIEEYSKIHFDIDSDCLYKFIYFKESEKSGLLFVVIHHILVDAATIEFLFDDIRNCYEKLIRSESVDSNLFDKQYLKYCQENAEKKVDKAFLQHQFELVSEDLLDSIKSEEYTKSVLNERNIKIPQESCEFIKSICAEKNATLYAGFYGLYISALYLSLSERSVVTTTTFSDRSDEDARTYGMYIYNQLISHEFSIDDTIGKVIESISKKVTETFKHPLVPVADAVRILGLPSDYLNVINNFVFTYIDSNRKNNLSGGISFEHVEIDKNLGDTNINFVIEKLDGEFKAALYYSDEIDKEKIKKLSETLEYIFENINLLADKDILSLFGTDNEQIEEEELGELF